MIMSWKSYAGLWLFCSLFTFLILCSLDMMNGNEGFLETDIAIAAVSSTIANLLFFVSDYFNENAKR